MISTCQQVVQSTGRGRAYNENSPLLGDTANVAFLAATYAKTAAGRFSKQASRYWCWARAQTRYMLGDGDRRLAILSNHHFPKQAPMQCLWCNVFGLAMSGTPVPAIEAKVGL